MSLPTQSPPVKSQKPSWARNIERLQREGYRLRFRPFLIDGHPADPYLLDEPDTDALVALLADKIGPPRRRTHRAFGRIQ